MIYTITLNPALDYVIETKKFTIGEINKSQKEHILPGGKGINVSIVLKELNIESTALGFIAGFVGDEIEKKVKKHGIETEFIKIENDISRINVKIEEDDKETAINTNGAEITQEHIELLYKKLEKIQNEDTLILAGSIPKGIEENIYETICEKLKNKKIEIIVDATGKLLTKTLKYQPFLIKPNQEELEEIFGLEISNHEEAIKYAKLLQQKGAKNVLVSMGKKGAILLDENGKTYKQNSLNIGKKVNTVGAGDSMVAGFVAGYHQFNNYEKALKLGTIVATATTQSMFLATKEEIDKLLNLNIF